MKNKKTTEQTNIFDWLKKAEELSRQATEPRKGSLDIDSELRAAVSEDLKHAVYTPPHPSQEGDVRELSRYEVAARMSDLVGSEITASMLYSWTSESHEKHRFPCQYLPAFVIATGGQRRAFEVLSRHSGLFALPGKEALRAEIERWRETEKKAKTERHRREILLKEIERGRKIE